MRKSIFELKEKTSKDEMRWHNFSRNVQNAKIHAFVTESKFWYRVIKDRRHLYFLFFLIPKVKRDRTYFYELLTLSHSKITAIYDQEFEAGAAFRDRERQLKKTIKEKFDLEKIEVDHGLPKNGKLFIGIFLLTPCKKGNKAKIR